MVEVNVTTIMIFDGREAGVLLTKGGVGIEMEKEMVENIEGDDDLMWQSW